MRVGRLMYLASIMAIAVASLIAPGDAMAQSQAASAATVMPYGVPASEVGALVLNATASSIASGWNQNWEWGADCNNDPAYPAQPPGQVAVDRSGNLDLTITGQPDNCAQAISPQEYTFGIFEARIYLPPSTGRNSYKIADWPAFWLVNGSDWPTDGEIDVAEGMGGFDYASFHYGTSPATEQSLSTYDGSARAYGRPIGTGWHTVDVVWAAGSVTIYYDGRVFTAFTGSYITQAPMNIVLTNTEGSAGLFPGTPSTMQVQYVRVWNLS
jgi:Glycosyl hydrolases family 16